MNGPASLPPLAGACVIVTRPVGNAASLKRRIAELGARAIGLPAQSLRAASDSKRARAALLAQRDADALIFVSPAAVRFAFALAPQFRPLRHVRVLAVGAATARALRQRGLTPLNAPRANQNSEGLLALEELNNVRGQRVAIVGAPGGRELLPATLARRGAQVPMVPVYRRVAARLDARHISALAGLSHPTFLLLSSHNSLQMLSQSLPDQAWVQLLQAEVIASSLRIAVAARQFGFTRVIVARSALSGDLLAAACTALARHRL
jgi:uroporphyrinogen-III synthase